MTGPTHLALVERLWACYEARDWAGARRLLAEDACCRWWTSGERFAGADAVIRVNAAYPEGWHIELLHIEPLTGRVLSVVRVDHGAATYYAHSWFRFTEEDPAEPLIAAIDEFWAEVAPAPAWREGLEGRELLPPLADPSLG